MKLTSRKKISLIATVIGLWGLSVLSVGCGKTDSLTGAIPAPQIFNYGDTCPIGSWRFWDLPSCSAAPDFDTACTWNNGTPITLSNGTRVCKFVLTWTSPSYYRFTSYNSLPRLTPSIATSSYAVITGINLRAGDRVDSLASASNYYKCGSTQYNFGGVANGDATATQNEGQDAGFTVSDSTQSYVLGLGGWAVVAHTGPLVFGVNAPSCSQSTTFKLVNAPILTVTHCEDTNHVTYSCN